MSFSTITSDTLIDATRGLYQHGDSGVRVIERPLRQEGIDALLAYVSNPQFNLKSAAAIQGRAQQQFAMRYFEKDSLRELMDHPVLLEVFEEYSNLIKPVAEKLGLEVTTPNSMGVHHYRREEGRITFHRDERAVQLTSILNLSGEATWLCARTYAGEHAQSWQCLPNTLFIMRGPRNAIERLAAKQQLADYDPAKNLCPIHAVDNVISDRYNLLFRHYWRGTE